MRWDWSSLEVRKKTPVSDNPQGELLRVAGSQVARVRRDVVRYYVVATYPSNRVVALRGSRERVVDGTHLGGCDPQTVCLVNHGKSAVLRTTPPATHLVVLESP